MGWLRKQAGTSGRGHGSRPAASALSSAGIGQVGQERRRNSSSSRKPSPRRTRTEQGEVKVRAIYGVLPQGDPNETFQKNLSTPSRSGPVQSNIKGGSLPAEATGQNLAGSSRPRSKAACRPHAAVLPGRVRISAPPHAPRSYLQVAEVVRLGAGRNAGWNALDNERLNLETQARGMGSTPMDSSYCAARTRRDPIGTGEHHPGTFYDTLDERRASGRRASTGAQGATGLAASAVPSGVFTPRKQCFSLSLGGMIGGTD
jgi:hypothetical protein